MVVNPILLARFFYALKKIIQAIKVLGLRGCWSPQYCPLPNLLLEGFVMAAVALPTPSGPLRTEETLTLVWYPGSPNPTHVVLSPWGRRRSPDAGGRQAARPHPGRGTGCVG